MYKFDIHCSTTALTYKTVGFFMTQNWQKSATVFYGIPHSSLSYGVPLKVILMDRLRADSCVVKVSHLKLTVIFYHSNSVDRAALCVMQCLQMIYSSEGFQHHFTVISKFVCCGCYMKKTIAFTLISFAVLK